MCSDQITHQFYNLCRSGTRGEAYHWFPGTWHIECDIPNCGVRFQDYDFIWWSPTECPGCETGATSAQFWQINGKEGSPLPKPPSLEEIFNAPDASPRYIKSGSPLSVSSDSHRMSRSSDAGQSSQRSRSRASDAGSQSSQVSHGTRLINSLLSGPWNEYSNAAGTEVIDSYFNGLTPGASFFNTPLSSYDQSPLGQRSRSQSRSRHAESRASSQAPETFSSPSQSQDSRATTPKASAKNTKGTPKPTSRGSRAATSKDSTPEQEFIASGQVGSPSKFKAPRPRPLYAGKHLDPPKALRSGKKY